MSSRLVARQLRAILAEGPPPLGASRCWLSQIPPLSCPRVIFSRIWSTFFQAWAFDRPTKGSPGGEWIKETSALQIEIWLQLHRYVDNDDDDDDDGGDDCNDGWMPGERTGRDCDGAAQVKSFKMTPVYIKQVKQCTMCCLSRWIPLYPQKSLCFFLWNFGSVLS